MLIADVDQSGKFEATKEDTVLAIANARMHYTILVPAPAKRQCILELRERGLAPKTFYPQLFATALYFLLRDHIARMTVITIDTEYQGKDQQIKQHLLRLLKRSGRVVETSQITFGYIGKNSPAHDAAITVLRKQVAPDLVVTLEEILGEFRR